MVKELLTSDRSNCSIMSQLRKFYARQNVFITGVTGFLGQVLLETLLRSCPGIGIIYVLIRAKKGKDEQERVDALLGGTVFDQLRSEYPNFSEKIVLLPGDITQDRLGLSTTDYDRVVSEVSVIFHLAATVRFNEKLDVATAMNVNSVKYIVDIAKSCRNLKVGVHVSTAYSHCVRDEIREELYPPPLSYEAVNKLIETTVANNPSEDEWKNITEKVVGKWPNTYTFTKAIGESVVAEFAKDLPFAIFRPSIVMNAYEEPIPGWINSLMGYPGIICGAGLGVLHIGMSKDDAIADAIPVDYACNALISCAWETAITERRSDEDVPVYNYVSGNENPITWGQLHYGCRTFGDIFCCNSAIYYPSVIIVQSLLLFNIMEFLLHIIPALMIDRIAVLLGKRPQFYNLVRKVGNGFRAFSYFTTKEWNFENRRVQNLWKRLSSEDRRIFSFSMRNLDWDEYLLSFVRGVRKHLVGESEQNLDMARRRHFYLYIVHTIVRLLTTAFALWIIWAFIRGIGLSISA